MGPSRPSPQKTPQRNKPSQRPRDTCVCVSTCVCSHVYALRACRRLPLEGTPLLLLGAGWGLGGLSWPWVRQGSKSIQRQEMRAGTPSRTPGEGVFRHLHLDFVLESILFRLKHGHHFLFHQTPFWNGIQRPRVGSRARNVPGRAGVPWRPGHRPAFLACPIFT